MESTLATSMDMPYGNDIPTTLSIVITMSGDQATVDQLKEELEKDKKENSELNDKVTKLEDNSKSLLRVNTENKLAATDGRRRYKKRLIF